MTLKLSKLFITIMLGFGVASAADINEVKPFVEKGVALCKEKGNQTCFDAFNNPKGGFVKGELYMFAYDFKGVNQALGSNPKLVGKNLYKLKDASGIMLLQELIQIAQTKGEGWLDYKWSHPKTKRIQDKTSFIKKIDGSYFIGAGIYK